MSPGPLELRCLRVIWRRGEANVKDVLDELLQQEQKPAYTTIMTTLDRLEKKGTLQRRKSGKAFVYSAALSEEEVREQALQHLLDSFFDGSRENLASWLQHGEVEAAPQQRQVSTASKLDAALL